MRRLLFLLIAIAFPASMASAAKTAEDHVQAVRQIGSILAEYTQKRGVTPYSENWEDGKDDGNEPVSIICNLSGKKIPDRLAYPPYSCTLFSPAQVEAYLSKGLGRKITLPKDDRALEHGGKPLPLFYTILINDGEFFVATYLTEPHKDARKLADKFYKFEVGSVAVPAKKIEKVAPPAPPK